MQKHGFGKTGLQVSSLGFGGGPIGYLDTDQSRVETIVGTLLDAGVNLVDTAAAYQGSEEALGKALAGRRDQLVLVSKCGQQFDDLPGAKWSEETITATVDRSLRRLKTDHLDVMLLHSCGLAVLERGEALGALVRARDAGKIRFAGYSGDNEEAVYAAGLPDIAVLETSVNLCDQANIGAVLPRARECGLGVIAKRPIANTAWKPAEDFKGIYRDYASDYRERFAAMGLRPQDLGFAGEQDWPEITLRFTLSIPGVHTAIIGTTNPENARRNLQAAARGPLPIETVAAIQSAFASAARSAGQPWPGLT